MPRIKPTKAFLTRERNLVKIREQRREDLFYEHGYVPCEGCLANGTQGHIEYSHHVGKGKSTALADHPENGAYMCRECHGKVEALDFEGLRNEATIVEFIHTYAAWLLDKQPSAEEIKLKQLRKDNLAA
jgi:hypothetical protein